MSEPTLRDLLKKLSGKKVVLTTRCGTLRQASGQIRDVFETFLLYTIQDERFVDQPATRHWILIDNLGVVTEDPVVKTDDIEVTRYEF